MKALTNKAMVMVGMALTVSWMAMSCSDSDFDSKLELGDNVVAEGIEAEIDGEIATLNIASNDDWTIDVPEDAASWVYVPVRSGHGNMAVPVSIDANFGSSKGRSTVLTITTGDVERKVVVSQVPSYQGESTTNEESADYIQIAATKGVGLGLNLRSLAAKYSVINLKAVDKLQKLNPAEYSTFFTYDRLSTAAAAGAVIDSVDTKKDSLGVKLTFDINYGAFKLNISGAYCGDESKNHLSTEYRYGATYNIASANADMPSLVAAYNEATSSDDASSTEQLLKRTLLTPGFIAAKNDVEEAYQGKDPDEISEAIEDLVGNYGPVVITGCDLGSSISLWMKYDRDSIADILRVDTARLNLAINVGLFKLGANVEVSYKKEGIQLLENSSFRYHIAGGTKAAQDNVSSILSAKRTKGDEDKVYSNLHDKLDAWIASLNADNPTTLTYTRLHIYPIWYFFQGKLRTEVKKWVKENYEDKMDIINNNVVDADVPD